jgi:carboxyl-terminal processing protease
MEYKIFTLPALLTMLLGLTACKNENKAYLDNFEIIWQPVNETYFDPTFGGLDWNEVHDRYQPQIAAAESDEEFYTLINKMLFELEVSHMAVVPPGHWGLLYPTWFAEGGIGIDVRLLDGDAVITSVEPGSPGDQAGLRPSLVIQSIDGATIEQIAEERLTHLEPPYNERMKRTGITNEILSRIYGPPETYISLAYLDEQGEVHEVSVARKRRGNKSEPLDIVLPPMFLEFESKRLDNGIGYIRFNCFHQALAQEILGAIQLMHDAPGLVIDIRGNPGGDSKVGIALAEQLVKDSTLFLRAKTQDIAGDVRLDPAENIYEGPVAVLIDVMGTSGSEIFAAGIQAMGRAVIMGERSPGCVLGGDAMRLPNGATFIYPVFQISTPDGTVLEGHGVVPDIEVALDRTLLLQGIDSQLEAAIRYIGKEIRFPA